MPKRSDEYMAARRNHILDAALQCYVELGFERMAVADICKAAGISMGALYKHFKTKRDIMLALADRALERQKLILFPDLESFRRFIMDEIDEFDTDKRCAIIRSEFHLIQVSLHDEDLRERSRDSILLMQRNIQKAMNDLKNRGQIMASYDTLTGAKTLVMTLTGLWLLKAISPETPARDYKSTVDAEFQKMTPDGARKTAKKRSPRTAKP